MAVLGGGRIEDQLGGGPDVDARAVALDEGDDGLVWDVEGAVVAHADEICHGSDATGRHGGVPIDPLTVPGSRPTGRGAGRPGGQHPGEAGVLLARRPEDLATQESMSAASTSVPQRSISSMSSQSLGRSKMALQTMRCSGARIGMSTGPKRTRRARSAISRCRSMVAKNTSR